MTRFGWMCVVAAACVGCGDDGNDGGRSDSGTSANTLFTGTACSMPVSFELAGDEKITVIFNTASGTLDGLMVADGPLFDSEDQAAWATYAASHDVMLFLAFDNPEPASPHTISAIFDSFVGARGVGTIGFVEHGRGEMVTIRAIDTAAKTIDVQLSLPVGGATSAYPPDFAVFDECGAGLVTGGFSGTYETLMF